jgi:hypothetical protein
MLSDMAIFAVIPLDPNAHAKLGAVLEKEFSGKYFSVGSDHWLLSANGTAQEISNKLGITTAPFQAGQAVVYTVGGYFGYAPQPVWEWLRINITLGGV